MSGRQYKSGSAKRKERDKKKDETVQPSLSSFLNAKKSRVSESTDSSISSASSEMQEQMQEQLSDCDDTLQDGDSIEEQEEDEVLVAPSTSSALPQECLLPISGEDDLPGSPNYDASDIGTYSCEFIPTPAVEKFIQAGPHPFPPNIPEDEYGRQFPFSVLHTTRLNAECRKREFLSSSPQKHAVYCFPCRLFSLHAQNSIPFILHLITGHA